MTDPRRRPSNNTIPAPDSSHQPPFNVEPMYGGGNEYGQLGDQQ